MKRVLLPLTEGVEEMEAVILIDVLRRAAWNVVSAGLEAGPVTASRGVRLLPDADWDDLALGEFDVFLLPGGGGGTEQLCADERVVNAAREFAASGRWVAAICAAPLVLHKAGLLEGKSFTSYPSVKDNLPVTGYKEEPVVQDGNLFTSRGPGTAFALALALISALENPAKAQAVAADMLYSV